MILSCPQCHVKYDIPSAYFAQGQRRVRCSNCSFEWEHRDPSSEKPVDHHSYRDGEPPVDASRSSSPDPSAEIGHDRDEVGFSALQGQRAERDHWQISSGATLAGTAGPVPNKSPFLALVWLVFGLLTLLYFASNSIVSALPMLAPLYRAVQVEPHGPLKGLSACVVDMSASPQSPPTALVRVENRGGIGRLAPEIQWAGGAAMFNETAYLPINGRLEGQIVGLEGAYESGQMPTLLGDVEGLSITLKRCTG